mgnify:CR=1 FL=1
MDPDISHIISEDERLSSELEAAKESARLRVESRRREQAEFRDAEFSRIIFHIGKSDNTQRVLTKLSGYKETD